MDGGKVIRYEIAIIIAAIILSGLVIWQFFTPLLLALITAYILYPLVSRLQKWVYFYDAALILAILILLAPLVALLNYIAGDVSAIVSSYNEFSEQVSGFFVTLDKFATHYGLDGYLENLPNLIEKVSAAARERLLQTLSNLPHILLSIVVYLAGTYFMLRDGHKAVKLVQDYATSLRMRDREAINNFFIGLKNSFDVLFVVHIGFAIGAGILCGIGFYIFDVPYPAVFAVLVTLFSFLPLLGAWIAYGSAAAMHYFTYSDLTMALVVLGWGFVFANLIPDFIAKPWVGAKVGKVHPMTILLGFIGGPFVFGFEGLLLGPIILVIAETVIVGFLELHTALNKAEKARKA